MEGHRRHNEASRNSNPSDPAQQLLRHQLHALNAAAALRAPAHQHPAILPQLHQQTFSPNLSSGPRPLVDVLHRPRHNPPHPHQESQSMSRSLYHANRVTAQVSDHPEFSHPSQALIRAPRSIDKIAENERELVESRRSLRPEVEFSHRERALPVRHQKQDVVEAVDHHFFKSIELAKKRFEQNVSSWNPAAASSRATNVPPASMQRNEDLRRELGASERERRERHFMNALAAGKECQQQHEEKQRFQRQHGSSSMYSPHSARVETKTSFNFQPREIESFDRQKSSQELSGTTLSKTPIAGPFAHLSSPVGIRSHCRSAATHLPPRDISRHPSVGYLGHPPALYKTEVQRHRNREEMSVDNEPLSLSLSSARSPDPDQPLDLGLPSKRPENKNNELEKRAQTTISVPSPSNKAKDFEEKEQRNPINLKMPEKIQSNAPQVPIPQKAVVTKESSINSSKGYVHKLKKTWLRSYQSEPTVNEELNQPTTFPSQSDSQTPSSLDQEKRHNDKEKFEPSEAPAISKTDRSETDNRLVENKDESQDDAEKSKKKSALKHRKLGNSSKAQERRLRSRELRRRRAGVSYDVEMDSDSDEDSNVKRETDEKNNSQNHREKVEGSGRKRRRRLAKDKKKISPDDLDDLDNIDFSKVKRRRRTSNPFNRPPTPELKQSGKSFLQDSVCFEVAPKMIKCRECRWTQIQRSQEPQNIFCRFYAFRRLHYSKQSVVVSGFCDPLVHPTETDISLWSKRSDSIPKLTKNEARYLITHLYSVFQRIVAQERIALKSDLHQGKNIVWKRVVLDVREMCDVCEATLFNYHWACSTCGFVVCPKCYMARQNNEYIPWGENERDRDEFQWLVCNTKQSHEPESLLLVQVIPGNVMEDIAARVQSFKHLSVIENSIENDGKQEDLFGKKSILQKPKTLSLDEIHKDFPNAGISQISKESVFRIKPDNSEGLADAFRRIWQTGYPILIEKNSRRVQDSLWTPTYFKDNFGDFTIDVINALTHETISFQHISKFWDGFHNFGKNAGNDEDAEVLVMKNWPPSGQDFVEHLSDLYIEIKKRQPFKEVVGSAVRPNLTAFLPDVFARPELGPRFVFAQGLGKRLKNRWTKNLHIDLADAMALVMYAEDCSITRGQKLVDLLNSDTSVKLEESTKKRVLSGEKLVGIWMVYNPRDTPMIRDFLKQKKPIKKEIKENDKENDNMNSSEDKKYYDPLFAGDVQLTEKMISTLEKEHNVSPYFIPQFEGEALMIPAGAPRQLKLIQSSMMVLLDFVAPESASQIYNVIQDMRMFSLTAPNLEDKLLIKNLIFHAVKNAVSTLEQDDDRT